MATKDENGWSTQQITPVSLSAGPRNPARSPEYIMQGCGKAVRSLGSCSRPCGNLRTDIINLPGDQFNSSFLTMDPPALGRADIGIFKVPCFFFHAGLSPSQCMSCSLELTAMAEITHEPLRKFSAIFPASPSLNVFRPITLEYKTQSGTSNEVLTFPAPRFSPLRQA